MLPVFVRLGKPICIPLRPAGIRSICTSPQKPIRAPCCPSRACRQQHHRPRARTRRLQEPLRAAAPAERPANPDAPLPARIDTRSRCQCSRPPPPRHRRTRTGRALRRCAVVTSMGPAVRVQFDGGPAEPDFASYVALLEDAQRNDVELLLVLRRLCASGTVAPTQMAQAFQRPETDAARAMQRMAADARPLIEPSHARTNGPATRYRLTAEATRGLGSVVRRLRPRPPLRGLAGC